MGTLEKSKVPYSFLNKENNNVKIKSDNFVNECEKDEKSDLITDTKILL